MFQKKTKENNLTSIPPPPSKPKNVHLRLKHHLTSPSPAKALSFHSPLKSPPIEDFPIDMTLENFYHPTPSSMRPVKNF